MENLTYNNIGRVLQLNKAGELIEKRMKAANVCEGLYVTEPSKGGYVKFICKLNGVVWVDCEQPAVWIERGAKAIPGYFAKILAGVFEDENIHEYKREISRRILHPDAPTEMELKQPERKKPAPLAEGQRKVSVMMFKGCTDEITDKNVVITEVVPHVYTYVYKLRRYGERVKIIFEIDGVYFQGSDNGAHIMERDNFAEVCKNAYEHARQNIAEGAAKGTPYFVELAKRIKTAQPEQRGEELTEQESEFITATETHRNAEGRVIAWEILNNGNGKVIFENSDKNRYVCAHVIKMSDGSYFLHFIGEKPGRPYERLIYKRKTNALKGFKMTEGRNIRQQSATPTEIPQISTTAAETGKVSTEAKTEQQGETTAPVTTTNCSKLPQPPKLAPQSTQAGRAVKCSIPVAKRAQRANMRPKVVIPKLAITYPQRVVMKFRDRSTYLPANPPPYIGSPNRIVSTGSTNQIYY